MAALVALAAARRGATRDGFCKKLNPSYGLRACECTGETPPLYFFPDVNVAPLAQAGMAFQFGSFLLANCRPPWTGSRAGCPCVGKSSARL